MADIRRILNKESWTGRELGILELTNTAVMLKQSLTGQPRQPVVEKAKLQQMINSITDRTQGRIYNGYISIHEWLTLFFNIAQTHYQQAQLRYKSLSAYIIEAELAEDVFKYIGSLPVIMTEKQYEEAVKRGRELYLKNEDGTDRTEAILGLIYRAIKYYAQLLTDKPRAKNPLRKIRSKYLAAPVESPLILSSYNQVTKNGYYTLEDGRRSDEMSREEWQAAITTPKMAEILSNPEGAEALETVEGRLFQSARSLYAGETFQEWQAKQTQRDYEARLTVPAQWHLYEEAPADLNKWEVLEDYCTMADIYGAAIGEYRDTTAEDYITEAKDFMAEFREAAEAVLPEIDSYFFNAGEGIATIPVEKWQTTRIPLAELYDKDFCGFRAEADTDEVLFDDNYRAVCHGVAILKPPTLDSYEDIDENGYYTPPEIIHTLRPMSLEGFFPENEEHAHNIEEVTEGREALLDSYYFLKGYNTAVDLIAAEYDVPELSVFKMDLSGIEEKINAINELVPVLYMQIYYTVYEDETRKQRKLQVLKDYFPEIKYETLSPPAENIAEVKRLFEDFKAFRERETIAELLMYRPEPDETGREGGAE